MQLWGIDIVGGLQLVDTGTGEVREAKIITGIDDHSRFLVMAQVVERATSRAVCLAFAAALARHGVPEEVITDNGKQFTDRFGGGGEVLFDKICRGNGIKHLLTQPASPNQNGKVERFHGTLRPEFLAVAVPFTSIDEAQAAVDAWVQGYNHDRPHQGLDQARPVTPADRFTPAAGAGAQEGAAPGPVSSLLPLWVPAVLSTPAKDAPAPGSEPVPASVATTAAGMQVRAVVLERTVPASGNLAVRGQQLWIGPGRAGQRVRLDIDCDFIRASIDSTLLKTVRSKLSLTDLAYLVAAENAQPSTLQPPTGQPCQEQDVIELERAIARNGTVRIGGHVVTIGEGLAGRAVGIRIEGASLLAFELDTREILRARPNPVAPERLRNLRNVRPPGPPLRPRTEPITVQRRASAQGVIIVTRHRVQLGRAYAGHTVTVHVSDTHLAIDLTNETRSVLRTTDHPVIRIKADRPRTATLS